ncbi:MAG: hypothetical protein NDP13_00470 [Crenarchaeota archaeon]|nr:hypothetical protein [Thermoproteota archaeon]MCR8454897.1 hypothetical protein [Thermoproteota archaeon]
MASEQIEQVLREKYARYLNIQQTVQAYRLLYENNRRDLEELLITIDALEKIKNRNLKLLNGFISLGPNVFIYVKGEIGDKILVNVGANTCVYMTIDDAISTLREREDSLRESLNKISKTIEDLIQVAEELEREIVSLQNYLRAHRKT